MAVTEETLLRRIHELEQELYTLKEKHAALAAVFEKGCATPPEWRLSRAQRRIYAALEKNKIATHRQIENALYYDRRNDHPGRDVATVQIYRMRRKLKKHSVEIISIPYEGYALTKGEQH